MKKLLALLLVLTLLAGTVCAAFTDADKITADFTEAVEYMSEKNIIGGFPDGTFKPKDTLTRAQAAKIICTVLEGADKVDAITATASFADVPADHWAAKYVGYCADKGIVSGVGNNKFDPNGKLIGAAFAKMLLVAYGADGSKFTGENWIINVQKTMREKGMSYKVGATSDPMMREQACQMAYNFLASEEIAKVEGYADTTVKFTASNVKLLGRAEATADGVVCHFPGDGVEFTLDCKGNLTLDYVGTASATYTAFIDEVESVSRTSITAGGKSNICYRFVRPGEHTIRIVQDTEVNTSGKVTTLTGLTGSVKTGANAKPTAKKSLYIEFLGDSITAGCGTLGNPKTDWSTATHAGSKSYGVFTAEKLNADYALIAKGGIGVTKPSANVSITDMFVYHDAWQDKTVKAKRDRMPDVVVIAMGANDKEESPDTVFHDGLKAYAETVRQTVGAKAKIVFIYGMMSVKHEAVQTGVCEELGGAAKGYYVFKMPTLINGVPAKVGGTPHPSAADNMKSSTELAEFIKSIL